jgi:hypothetical protein
VKKYLLLFSVVICLASNVFAKNRTANEASQLAGQFVNQPINGLSKAPASSVSILTLCYTSQSSINGSNGKKVFYYAFNKGNNKGYVIVSGDDRARSILGYADAGNFDFAALPTNAKDWLSFYETEIKSLPDSDVQLVSPSIPPVSKVQSSSLRASAITVSPLLGNIKWDQGAPYNIFCPIIDQITTARAVTGCVATGMAQVMRYYKWPAHGTGSNSYTTTTLSIPLSLDFSKTTFNWDNMTETYGSSSTLAQDTAVATLMYNCGVAVNMDYGTSSGAFYRNMALALKNNFGYDSNLQLYPRNYYTRSEWVTLLTTELNAGRPVLYSGQTDSGGHLFVCDGYDSNGLFHFNWGWSGISNGYFQISALDPDNQGIGSSTGGYNTSQSIVVGMQKPNFATTPVYLIYSDLPMTCTSTSISRSASFSATSNSIYNLGINTFNGNFGLALFDSNGLVSVIKSYSVSSLLAGYGWATYVLTTSIPSGIANGTYKLYYVYKASTDANWQIVRGSVGTANYLNVVVTTSAVTINAPAASSATLNLNSLTVTGNLYQNITGRFTVSVTNTGNEYNSKLGINLKSTSNSSVYQLVTSETVNIAAGETRSLDFTGTITVAPGQYYVTAVYDPANNYTNTTTFSQLGTALTKDVLTTPTGTPLLTLRNLVSFPNSASVDKNNAVLSATIKNSSGFFDSKLIAFIFPTSGGNSLCSIGYQNAYIDSNEEKIVTFNGPIDLMPGQYGIAVYYLNSSSSWSIITPSAFSNLNFTLVDYYTVRSQLSDSHLKLYPNPVRDNLQLSADATIQRLIITDLLGKLLKTIHPLLNHSITIPVSDLKSGAYLLKMETNNDSRTVKFIKY